jgi:hypothetical protein
MGSLRVVSEARRARRLHEPGVFARFRYNDLKEAARDLRRTRALCKFNGGKERRRTALEKDVRSEGRHRGTECVGKHFRIGESRFMPQP